MLLVALMLVAQADAVVPPTTALEADEVVVAAERLKRFRAVTRKDRKSGLTQCIIKRRSGDPALDDGICAALVSCSARISKESEIRPCMEPAIKALLPKMTWSVKRARD